MRWARRTESAFVCRSDVGRTGGCDHLYPARINTAAWCLSNLFKVCRRQHANSTSILDTVRGGRGQSVLDGALAPPTGPAAASTHLGETIQRVHEYSRESSAATRRFSRWRHRSEAARSEAAQPLGLKFYYAVDVDPGRLASCARLLDHTRYAGTRDLDEGRVWVTSGWTICGPARCDSAPSTGFGVSPSWRHKPARYSPEKSERLRSSPGRSTRSSSCGPHQGPGAGGAPGSGELIRP